MKIQLDAWMIYQILIGQKYTRRDERSPFVFENIRGGRPLTYSIAISDDGRKVCVEIAARAASSVLPEVRALASKLGSDNRWQATDCPGGVVLATEFSFKDYRTRYPHQLFISRILEMPSRRLRGLLNRFERAAKTRIDK